MRALTPTPPQNRRHPLAGTPAADGGTPLFVTAGESPESVGITSEALPGSSIAPQETALPLSPGSTPEDSAAEVLRLREEVARLKGELQMILDHSIESDTRLTQFTDKIFVANSADVNTEGNIQNGAAPVAVDCGVQCELGDHDNVTDNLTTEVAEEPAVHLGLIRQPTAVRNLPRSEYFEIIDSLKTTVEVLSAENQWLKQEAKTCKCTDINYNQPWTEVRNKKQIYQVSTNNRFHNLQIEDDVAVIQQKKKINQKKNGSSQIYKKRCSRGKGEYRSTRSKLRFNTVAILGDSHTRHLAGLVRSLVDLPTSVSGLCKPGAKLPDIVNFNPKTVSSDTELRCEVLIAGTNDLATGAQDKVYRHLEEYVTSRPPGTEVVVATLPHRHDLRGLDHPIHDETVLVNAFIQELAARHHFQVLKLDGIARRNFTRHGQHLTMRGKRLVAKLLVKSLCASVHEGPASSRLARLDPAPPSECAVTTRPGHRTFAEAVVGSPSVSPPPALTEEREDVFGSQSVRLSPALPDEREAVFLAIPLVNDVLS